MNWPFASKAVKTNLVPRNLQKDFEKESQKIVEFEQINKKFYKDVKKYVEALDESTKSELKMINNLSNLTQMSVSTTNQNDKTSIISLNDNTNDDFNKKINLWKQLLTIENSYNLTEKLKDNCQNDIIEPMKRLNDLFPNVHASIKKRELAFNELLKHQSKLERYQEKERTGSTLVKIEQLKQNVIQAKEQFIKEHNQLMNELPKFYQSRLSLVYPSLKKLINSQCDFYNSYSIIYDKILNDSLTSSNDKSTTSSTTINSLLNDDIDFDIKKCLEDIKSLSIVAGD
jgi:hypothetical protein